MLVYQRVLPIELEGEIAYVLNIFLRFGVSCGVCLQDHWVQLL